MSTATARQIIVPTKAACLELKVRIEAGADFGELAKTHSQVPSGNEGGKLATFEPGELDRAFDRALFKGEVGAVQGPIKSPFGWHLVQVVSRSP